MVPLGTSSVYVGNLKPSDNKLKFITHNPFGQRVIGGELGIGFDKKNVGQYLEILLKGTGIDAENKLKNAQFFNNTCGIGSEHFFSIGDFLKTKGYEFIKEFFDEQKLKTFLVQNKEKIKKGELLITFTFLDNRPTIRSVIVGKNLLN